MYIEIVPSPVPNRSRIEVVLLWAQWILVLGTAMSLAQDTVTGGPRGNSSWVSYLPLLAVLPATAAFRAARAAVIGVLVCALAAFAGFAWSEASAGWQTAMLSAVALTWPLFAAAALLFAAVRVRMDREREASRLHRHTRANRMEIEESEACGCIACERIFFPGEVVRWIVVSGGETAVCPHCGVDAVVGSASGIPIMPGVLRRAHERWFLAGEVD